jgi:predicted HTH transcriptional regulator
MQLIRKPPFPSDEALADATHFPYSESQIYEFKRNIQHYESKVMGTICAFLNSQGGYLVFGIDDETLEIVGVKNDQKSIDNFIIDIDRIYHLQRIVETRHMARLLKENIVVRTMAHPRGKLLIVDVSPCAECSYQLCNGSSYVRLNASNMLERAERFYTEEEARNLVKNKEHKAATKYDRLVRSLRDECNEKNREIDQLTALLFQRILQDKMSAEKQTHTVNIACCIC